MELTKEQAKLEALKEAPKKQEIAVYLEKVQDTKKGDYSGFGQAIKKALKRGITVYDFRPFIKKEDPETIFSPSTAHKRLREYPETRIGKVTGYIKKDDKIIIATKLNVPEGFRADKIRFAYFTEDGKITDIVYAFIDDEQVIGELIKEVIEETMIKANSKEELEEKLREASSKE